MNIEVTNDFLEYLLKTMISGMGIPPEFLSYSEQTEFARSLGMMNGKFVRSIIVLQKVFGTQFTKMFRLLYKNEYLERVSYAEREALKKKVKVKNKGKDGVIDTKEEKEALNKENEINKEIEFDLDDIEVSFPSPQTLNMTTLSEQISNSQSIIDFLVTALVDEQNQELSSMTKREITKDILPNFDWTKYEDIVDKAKMKIQEDKIKLASVQSEEEAGGDMNSGF